MEAVKSDPPFEAVIHTASPFHFNVTDAKKDLLDPAIIGTTGVLKAIKKNAPAVKRVVRRSKLFLILGFTDGTLRSLPRHLPQSLTVAKATGQIMSTPKRLEPISEEEAIQNPANGYRASKTFAEKAAWDFLEEEKPNFTLATMCRP
jgi:nucleoside-diphosphate-sugar epimerase